MRQSKNRRTDSRDYELPDPTLRAYDHGLGTLSVDGELEGYLACVVGKMAFPEKAPWPWFVVVWADGTKENPMEDYGPRGWTVRELDAGRLEYHGPSSHRETRFLGFRFTPSLPGPPRVFDFVWLPATEARLKWLELGLVDSDF